MHHLDNDMDELFRKAARDYSLMLQEENWENIAAKLVPADAVPVGLEKKKSEGNKYALLAIAFLSLLISGAIILSQSKINNKKAYSNAHAKQISGLAPKENPILNINKEPRSSIDNKIAAFINSKKKSNSGFSERSQSLRPGKKNLQYIHSKINQASALQTDLNEYETNNTPYEQKYIKPENYNRSFSNPDNTIIQNKILGLSKQDINKMKQDTLIIFGKKRKPDGEIKKEKHFYVAIVAGPQFNQVKSQGYSEPGFSAGLLAGYHINNRMAVETGLLISEKKYFSSGAYFNMSKVSNTMPAGMKVISLHGKSTVLEIPITLKYDIIKKNKGIVFGTAGISSFILTKESNKYLALVNNSQQNLTGNYSNNQKYFIAALNISAGYEYKTGKKTSLRIEPYLQIPLKAIGVGSMPVSSAGVHLGISFPVIK